MRTIFVLFDSLNRTALGAYGGKAIATPHFDRFADRAMVFDRHYVGSLPCMPARRDMHSGRLNFTHRSWGPLEPFDHSFAQILKERGVHTHLISDHLHYFEDGGTGFHSRFTTWDFIRGQEYDPWIAMVQPPLERYRDQFAQSHYGETSGSKRLQHMINREHIERESDFPGPRCFAAAFDFLERNADADDWLLMLECFDPHEPFHAPERFKSAYKTEYAGKILDWPHYERVVENSEEIAEIRANYAALVAMCDHYFGRLLDWLDLNKMWDDTAVILSTDHGFLLSEHDWWGKCRMPYYEEVSHIPLIIHDPRKPWTSGQRSSALTQTADLAPTLLALHGAPTPKEMQADDLGILIKDPQTKGRETALFGVFGGPLGITDGQWVLYHYPPDFSAEGLYEFTLAPAHMSDFFTIEELRTGTFVQPFDFTRGVPIVRYDALPGAKRVPMNDGVGFDEIGTRLYDLKNDPRQQIAIENKPVAMRLRAAALGILQAHDAPKELIHWYGLS